MSELTDILDQAIDRLRRGEALEIILADYPLKTSNLGPVLATATALEALRPVPTPVPDSLANDRNVFLTELGQLSEPAVSGGPLMRLKEWIAHYSLPKSIQLTVFKEQRRMNTLLIKATFVLILLLGSTGGAAVASADSLPGRPLYSVKIILEDTWLALTPGVVDQAALQLNLAQVRLKEIKQLALGGEKVPEATLARLQLHLNQTLHLAAQAPDETMLGLLTRTRQMVQDQEQALTQTQAQVTGPAQEPLHQAGTALKQAGQEAEIGLQDPQTFRHRWQHAEGGNLEPPCDEADCDPQRHQHQNQQQLSDPPGEPCTGDNCPGEPAQNQNQQQHQNQHQLSDPPGESCPGDDCPGGPVQNQNQQQHQNQQQLSDPPNESCTGDNCPGEPAQNQNQQQLSDPPNESCTGDNCPGESVQNQNQQHQALDQEEIRDRERARTQEQSQDGPSAGPDDNGNADSDNGASQPDNDGSDNNSDNSGSGGNDAPPPGNVGSDDSGGNSDNSGGDNGGDSGSDEGNDNENSGSGNNGDGNGGEKGGGGGNK